MLCEYARECALYGDVCRDDGFVKAPAGDGEQSAVQAPPSVVVGIVKRPRDRHLCLHVCCVGLREANAEDPNGKTRHAGGICGVEVHNAETIGHEASLDPSAGGNPLPTDAATYARLFRSAVKGDLALAG